MYGLSVQAADQYLRQREYQFRMHRMHIMYPRYITVVLRTFFAILAFQPVYNRWVANPSAVSVEDRLVHDHELKFNFIARLRPQTQHLAILGIQVLTILGEEGLVLAAVGMVVHGKR